MKFIKHSLNHNHLLCMEKGIQGGFTYIELIVVGLIISLIAGGIWAVYYSVVNTYYEEQRGALIQAEGQSIMSLITHGGHHKGRRIYGLSSSYPESGYPRIGQVPSDHFDNDDYKIEFVLDDDDIVPEHRRYAAFYVDFDGANTPTSNLYFKLYAANGNPEDNYDENGGKGVLITENLLQRTTSTDKASYGDYDKTWFKAQLLPKDTASDYYSGMKTSFYLVDKTQPLIYNYQLDRKLFTPISDPAQRKRYLGAIPYPKYFSTCVYFMNRE